MQINLLTESIMQQASLFEIFNKPIITTLVTSAITILGFVFTYRSIKKVLKMKFQNKENLFH